MSALLKVARVATGLTLSRAAQHLRCSVSFLSDVEHERRYMSWPRIIDLCRFYECDPVPVLAYDIRCRSTVDLTEEAGAEIARIVLAEYERS